MVSPYAPNGGPPVSSPYGTEWGAPNAAPTAPRSVYVELHTDNPRARIDRVVEGMPIPVCVAPCLRWLDTQGIYVITGEGVRSTSRFVLPDDRSTVTLDVRAGSTARVILGALLIGGGIVTTYIGALVWEAGTLSDLSGDTQGAAQTRRVGQTMVAIGIPAAVIGIYLAASSHTSVTSSTGSTFTQETPPPRRKRSRVALTPRGLEF